ncbi:MAG: Creatininase [Solirubrobacterales bacterium]|nr:Creatininase [Solirubrobacterales bacterium]
MPQTPDTRAAPRRLTSAVWPQLAAADRRVLLVPLGALEQHGPHLPLDTDTRIARAVALGAAGGRQGAWVAPALPVGASGEHAAFPGTLSIGTDALRTVLVELVRHAAGDWGHVLLVNAHGGNAGAVTAAVRQLGEEGRACSAHHAGVPGGDAHAGRTETALMLHLAPDDVRTGELAPGDTRPVDELLDALRADGVRAVSPTGVLGDPRGATAAEGARLLDTLIAACAARLDTILETTEHPHVPTP